MSFLTPYMIWIKVAAVAALVAAAAYLAWDYRGAISEREQQAAVDGAVKGIKVQLENERLWRVHYQDLAEKQLAGLSDQIGNIKIEHVTITQTVREEVKANPKFYQQPLPDKGYEQWLKARALATGKTSPSTAPTSPSQPPR